MGTEGKVRIIVYADYLCPWCYNAAVRLQKIKEEYKELVEIRWKSFMLRLEPPERQKIDLKELREWLKKSWGQVMGQEESGIFHFWESDEPFPTHSIPPLEAAKCAQLQGEEAFERYHALLLKGFFQENRDISDRRVLIDLAERCRLDVEQFARNYDRRTQQKTILSEFFEAIQRYKVDGVPTAIFENSRIVVGAVPREVYRKIINNLLDSKVNKRS
ncbi:MAG: DsbA family protein [Candidatus Tectomicrobia bacterium]|nr:DsbA family protein [Candidatus Tectomicrobia bacterium]